MGSGCPTVLFAGLAALLLAFAGESLASGGGVSRDIGKGLDTMVLVPAGWFIMGSDHGEYEDERPQRRVYLYAFYIDKYPVTNAQFRRFGRPEKDYGPRFNGDSQPVVGVTWYQARDYCRSGGKRLPTEAEWEKAARGWDGRNYPWGNEWDGSKLIWWLNSGRLTHPVDRTYNSHRSPFGAVDMVGNVWEWVADWFDKDYYRNAPVRNPKGPSAGSTRVVRGGSWLNLLPWFFRPAYRDSSELHIQNLNVSFRCARSAS